MTVRELYTQLQGDYEDALQRFSTEDLIVRFVKRFSSDSSFRELLDAVECGNISLSFEAAHKMKGVAGTLSFTQLYRALHNLTEQLRSQVSPADPSLFEEVCRSYCRVMDALDRFEKEFKE